MLFLVIQLFKLYLAFSGLFSGLFFYFNLVSDENSSLNYPTFRIGWPTRVMLTTKPGSQTFRILNKVGCVFQMARHSIVTHLLYSQLISKVKPHIKPVLNEALISATTAYKISTVSWLVITFIFSLPVSCISFEKMI